MVPNGQEKAVQDLIKELSELSDPKKWKFVYRNEEVIEDYFNGLNTTISLEETYASPYVFIIDKDLNLRGRNDDEDEENNIKYGYNSSSVADLNNKMVDDVKIILAEYRLALKKNNNRRKI